MIHQDTSEAFNPSLDEKPYFLVANLPYYVASHIILKALEDKNCLGLIVMVQREMAENSALKKEIVSFLP